MDLRKETERIIDRFSSQPGVESEELDIKSKEIVETKEKRIKLVKVLSAMANQNGGTVIIGARTNDKNELLLQGFDVDSEVKQYLSHTAIEYTIPPVTEQIDINFVECTGKNLLRIDVSRAKEEPIRFKQDGEFVPWIRMNDGMERMSQDQIVSFFKDRSRARNSIFTSDIKERVAVQLDIGSQGDVPDLPSPPDHLLITTGNQSMIVCGEGGLSHDFGKSTLYHIDERLYVSSPDGIEEVFKKLESIVGSNLDYSNFGYGIKLGRRQVLGRDHGSFVEDLRNIESVSEALQEAHKSGPADHSPPENPYLIAVGYARCNAGIFWLQTQWRGDSFTGTRCGFVFTDLPFRQQKYQKFYEELGAVPDMYEQRRGTQILKIAGESQYLGNTNRVDLASHPDMSEYMSVENPFYGRVSDLRNQIDDEVPDYLTEPLDGVNRFPLNIGGGASQTAENKVVLDSISLFSKNLLVNTVFVSGWCRFKSV